jgi:hypothetical protein
MRYIAILTLFIYTLNAKAQEKPRFPEEYAPLSLNVNYGFQLPVAHMAQRFGFNMSFGLGMEYLTLPKGWIFNFDTYYIYGQNVREDVLTILRTQEGEIIGDLGEFASVDLRQRGYYGGVHIGKLLKLSDNGNRFKGIRFTIGGGFMQHRIRIQDNTQSVPHLDGIYKNGYDRLSNGPAFTQFIGYQVVSRDRTVNFFMGLEITEGFVKNRRVFNYDTRQRDTKTHLDILYGLRIGWSLPLFSNQKADDIEY